MKIPTGLSSDLEVALEAAQNAANVMVDAYQTDIMAESKGDKGIVTEFDTRAEQAIVETLLANSAYSILGEESGLSDRQSEAIWVIDPIDGTTNFARGLPLFAVSIALMRGHDIVLGVIFNPTTNEYFFAEQGQGAYRNGRRIQVSSVQEPTRAVVCLERGYGEEDVRRMAEIFRRLGAKYNFRILGTTALELCTVAAGLTDAFISSGDELWDFAAGVLLVQEAGGKFTDWRGDQWHGRDSFIFASNGHLHELLLKEIRNLQPG